MQIAPGMKLKNCNDPREGFGTVGGTASWRGITVMVTCFHCVFHFPPMRWDNTEPVPGCGNIGLYTDNGFVPDCAEIAWTLRDDQLDAGLIKPLPGIGFDRVIPKIGTPGRSHYLPETERGVTWLKKYGAATGLTYGRFEGFTKNSGEPYETETIPHPLSNLIIIRSYNNEPFCEPGDSGSLVLNEENKVVGMLVRVYGDTGFAMQATLLESRLGITF